VKHVFVETNFVVEAAVAGSKSCAADGAVLVAEGTGHAGVMFVDHGKVDDFGRLPRNAEIVVFVAEAAAGRIRARVEQDQLTCFVIDAPSQTDGVARVWRGAQYKD